MTSCTDHAVKLSPKENDVSLIAKFIALSNCKILIPCDKQYFCRIKSVFL